MLLLLLSIQQIDALSIGNQGATGRNTVNGWEFEFHRSQMF